MSLAIYNTLTRTKEIFHSQQEQQVGLYVCGVTVYDYCHLGHARAYVAFDLIVNHLRFLGYEVNYIRNITDIDDKIIKRANEAGKTVEEITQEFTQAMHDDFAALRLSPPTAEPRATEHIDEIIAIIQTLMANGYAYQGNNGDIFYDISRFESYGKLSNKNVAELRSGARVAIESAKEDPLDFVLWKMSKPGEPSWPSPWGEGRPGWHIECSAMSMKCLGHQFDIHGGGPDLIFPHHENEIAQSEGATGKQFANTWIHVGILEIDKVKMSKSLGNFLTIRDTLKKYPAEVIRYFMTASHYRSPLHFSEQALENAHKALQTLYLALRDLPLQENFILNKESFFVKKFCEKMNDDFNTPEALTVFFDIAHEINKHRDKPEYIAELGNILRYLGKQFKILQEEPNAFLQGSPRQIDSEEVEALIVLREKARIEKNWGESDRIRDSLRQKGIELEDTPSGTKWRVVG